MFWALSVFGLKRWRIFSTYRDGGGGEIFWTYPRSSGGERKSIFDTVAFFQA